MELRRRSSTPESRKLDFQRNVRQLCFEYEKNYTYNEPLDMYGNKMRSYRTIRKIFIYINRRKPDQFSFVPNNFKFWRTVAKTKYKLLSQIDRLQNNKSYTNSIECRYLELVKKTLTLNDTKYAFKIGLLLHRRFNQDIALVIYDYLM